MGRKARNRAHKLFAIEKMIRSYDNVFKGENLKCVDLQGN